MTTTSRRVAGVLLIVMPTVVLGGVSILALLAYDPANAANPLRQDLWRAGHAHAGVLLVLSLVALRYVDESCLTERVRWFVRLAFPTAAVLLPLAFFLSVLDPAATEPNALVNLAYVGAVVLVAGMITLGVGLVRSRARTTCAPCVPVAWEPDEVTEASHRPDPSSSTDDPRGPNTSTASRVHRTVGRP